MLPLTLWMCAVAILFLFCVRCCVHSVPSCWLFAYLLSSNLSESSRGGILARSFSTTTTHNIHRPFQIFVSRLFTDVVPLLCPHILHLVYHLFAQLCAHHCSLSVVSLLFWCHFHLKVTSSSSSVKRWLYFPSYAADIRFLIYYRLSGNSSRHKFHNLVIRLVGQRESTAAFALTHNKSHHIFIFFSCSIIIGAFVCSGGGPRKMRHREIGNLGAPSVSQ
jgi:hypothetical protein